MCPTHQQRYDEQGQATDVRPLSTSTFEGGPRLDAEKTFAQVKEEYLGHTQVDYFVAKATITFFKHDQQTTPWYTRIPSST